MPCISSTATKAFQYGSEPQPPVQVVGGDAGVGEGEQIDDGLEVRRGRDDAADVEVAVGEAVDARAHPRSDRVIDGRVAQRAGDAHRRQVARRVEEADDAEHGVLLDERQRDRRIVEVHAAVLQRLELRARERVGVDLEPEPERGRRAQRRHRLVEVELTAPEGLIAERVEAEDLPSARQELARVVVGAAEEVRARSGLRGDDPTDAERRHEGET
jgi:hypothetical protein